MHIQTHILSGWVVGNCFRLTGRERLFCMIAAAAADFDGIGIAFSQELYWALHHKLGHNIFLGLMLAAVLTAFSNHRAKVFPLYCALFALHMWLDYLGSGPGWRLYLLWPVSDWSVSWFNAWEFYSWQNISTAFALVAVTIGIAIRLGRTPLEVIMPKLDAQLVDWLRARIHRPRPAGGP